MLFHRLIELPDTSYHLDELKVLTRQRFYLNQDRSRYKNKLRQVLEVNFPELEKIVDIHGKAIRAMLNEYPSAKSIASSHLRRLANILEKNSRGAFKKEKAEEIRELARISVGKHTRSAELELTNLISSIKHLDGIIGNLKMEIKEIMLEIDSPSQVFQAFRIL